jgi:FecR protein
MNTFLSGRTAFAALLSSALLSTASFAQNVISAHPGTLNYIEGQVSVEGRQVTLKSVGQTTLQPGEYLATANGKAEVLLTPGVFLRLGSDTTVKMISPDLTHTEIQLDHGRATVEVDQIYKQNRILIDQPGGQTQVLQNGFYEFDAANSAVRVFEGRAAVFPGLDFNANIKPIVLKGEHQLALTATAGSIKPAKFDRNATQASDNLYAWSDLRSNYLGQANLTLANEYAGGYGYGNGFTPGWYWAPGLYSYTWLPGDGLFWSPFGYGFYSPWYIYGGGYIYGGRGFYGGHPVVGGYRGGVAAGYRGGTSAGFSGGGAAFHGGGGGGGHR